MAQARLAIVAVALWLFASTTVLAAAPQKKPPLWSGLSQDQQEILAPLAADWDKLDAQRKRKWLGIAKRYPTLSPAEQEKVKQNMQPWAQLTPEERRAARERYKNLQKLPPEQKKTLAQAWEEYQRLPEEERKKLEAAGKAPKPAAKPRTKPAAAPAPQAPEPVK